MTSLVGYPLGRRRLECEISIDAKVCQRGQFGPLRREDAIVNEAEIYAGLTTAFHDVFDDDDIVLSPNMAYRMSAVGIVWLISD
jgi:hypothetical protein